jgi:GcrA cell cycle regulator
VKLWREWHPEQSAALAEMWRADVAVAEIVSTLQSKFNEDLTYKAVLAKAASMELPRRRAINPNRPLWTDEAKDRLRFLYADPQRLSASIIARRMNEEFGASLTRNAIVGQIDRLGLPKRGRAPAAIRVPRVRVVRGQVIRAAAPIVDIDDQQIPIDQRKTLLELERHHCRWPVGDPQADLFFCGAVKLDDHSYCAAHHHRSLNYTRPARHFAFPDQRSRFAA